MHLARENTVRSTEYRSPHWNRAGSTTRAVWTTLLHARTLLVSPPSKAVSLHAPCSPLAVSCFCVSSVAGAKRRAEEEQRRAEERIGKSLLQSMSTPTPQQTELFFQFRSPPQLLPPCRCSFSCRCCRTSAIFPSCQLDQQQHRQRGCCARLLCYRPDLAKCDLEPETPD